jgi:peptidoglycan L-alanyl-D-glutamate endopeptidase CwlK
VSRSLVDLTDEIRLRAQTMLTLALEDGLDLLVYCTYRTPEEQARLYRRGRSLIEIESRAQELSTDWQRPDLAEILLEVGPQYGRRIVTYAAPGQSAHQYRVAWDAVPMRAGKPVWHTEEQQDRDLWMRYGRVVESIRMDWAGNWSEERREFPHAQIWGFDWREWIL